MGIVLDAIILLIVFFTVSRCFKKGFVTSVWEAGKNVLAIGIAWLLGKRIGGFLATNYFDDAIIKIITDKLSAQNTSSAIYDFIDPLKKLMQACKIDIDDIILKLSVNTHTVDDIAEAIALPISEVISNLIGYAVAFCGAYLIFWAVVILLNKLMVFPKLKQINGIFGGCFGVLCSTVFVIMFVVVTKIIAYCATVIWGNDYIMNLIDSSYIFKFISDIQLLIILNR